MKRIGIILRDYKSMSSKDLLAIRKDLIEILNSYNVLVYCIPIDFENINFKRVEELLEGFDGIILPGGSKDYPIDLKIVKYLYDNDIPTLGICLGMQMMALTFNGNLSITKNHQSDNKYVHKVKINKRSRLYSILKEEEIWVNSRHNEYITHTNLSVSAKSLEDGIIEAVEDPRKKFFIGVEWHPESITNDTFSKKLFDTFIKQL